MDDFLKQFRENLEARPEPAFEEGDWLALQNQLNSEGRNRIPLAWWWVAAPLAALLMGSNAFFFWQWKNIEQQLANHAAVRDTVVLTKVIHLTDTIYRTRILRENVIENRLAFSPKHQFGKTYQGELESEKQTRSDSPPNQETELAMPPTHSDSSRNNATKRLLSETQSLSVRAVRPIPIRRATLPTPDIFAAAPMKKSPKTFSHHLYAARPKAFRVGVSSGLVFPFGPDLDFESGYSVGAHVALDFSPRLRLWAEVAYVKTLFLTERMGEDIGVPEVGPPSSEYVFLQAEVPQPFVQYSAGMQYLFRAERRLKPFVGLGFGANSFLPYDVTYEFENTALNVEWNLDKTINSQGVPNYFMSLPVGLEFGFSKKWSAQMQATYRYNWKHSGIQSPQILGIQGGVNYKL